MSRLLIVDRLAGDQLICETPDRERVVVPLAAAPPGVAEGDCLREENGAFHLDPDETKRRRAHNRDRFRSLLAEEGE